MNRILNWKKEPVDKRDYKFSQNFKVLGKQQLPSSVDLSNVVPEIWDQETLGSCTAFSTCMSVLYQSRIQGRPIDPSKLFLYYNTRVLENTVNEDSGAYIRTVYKTLNKEGVCKEQCWPYIINKFTQKPTDNCYTEAIDTLATVYYSLNKNLVELKSCLALGRPFVFGFYVYSSFMSDSWDSMMPLPNKRREYIQGGHAIVCVGFDDSKQAFRIKNSWGQGWKDKGYFWMPYSFAISEDTDDFWTIESISTNKPKPVDTAVDISKVFSTKKELSLLPEIIIVRIGQLLSLNTDMIFTKRKNIDIVANYLNLK